MDCPECNALLSVLETRDTPRGYRRRRVCPECGGRVTTYEVSDTELARTARDIEAYRGAGLRYEREIARLNDAVHDANAVAGRVSQRKEEVLVERVGREQDAAHTAYT